VARLKAIVEKKKKKDKDPNRVASKDGEDTKRTASNVVKPHPKPVWHWDSGSGGTSAPQYVAFDHFNSQVLEREWCVLKNVATKDSALVGTTSWFFLPSKRKTAKRTRQTKIVVGTRAYMIDESENELQTTHSSESLMF